MKKSHRGYTVGNSVLAAEVISEGKLLSNIRYNPPCFETGENSIRRIGSASIRVIDGGREIPFSDFRVNIKENTYPFYSAQLETDNFVLEFEAFAPVTPHCSEDMFLPFILMKFTLARTENRQADIVFSFDAENDYGKNVKSFISIGDGFGSMSAGASFSGCGSEVIALFGIYDEHLRAVKNLKTEKAIAEYGKSSYEKLRKGIFDFIKSVPHFGNEKVFEYTRWYTQASVMLTKADVGGNVITMGYNELNQRDSYWTTFMHLFLFPDLELRMIGISAENQSENGKIPTTLLPLIERYYDIDINEYFCLRIARYYEFYRDKSFLERYFGNYKKSVDFLLSCDRDGDMIPEQEPPENPECFWGDWKDVSYIAGRKLAPHFCLLWLAVLKKGVHLAEAAGEKDTAEKYREIYNKAFVKINSAWDGTDKGGLLSDDGYAEIWYDGKKRHCVLEDQTVGVFFDVVPDETCELIWKALKKNECECGIRETFPYRMGDEVWNRGGTYHNGGVWPWLMFCDLAGRYKHGRESEVVSYIEKLGYYDLEKPGDFRPNEYLDAESGENCGFEVQGWSSAVWAIEYAKHVVKFSK